SCVSFSSSGDDRDLHSFPTRRSSDLGGAAAIVRGIKVWSGIHGFSHYIAVPFIDYPAFVGVAKGTDDTQSLDRHYHGGHRDASRSEEHTSELRHVKISYAVFCLKKKK